MGSLLTALGGSAAPAAGQAAGAAGTAAGTAGAAGATAGSTGALGSLGTAAQGAGSAVQGMAQSHIPQAIGNAAYSGIDRIGQVMGSVLGQQGGDMLGGMGKSYLGQMGLSPQGFDIGQLLSNRSPRMGGMVQGFLGQGQNNEHAAALDMAKQRYANSLGQNSAVGGGKK